MSAESHPLVGEFVAALRPSDPAQVKILLVGAGSGRHIPALLAAGVTIEAIEPDASRARTLRARFDDPRLAIQVRDFVEGAPGVGYAGALSTHAYLHGPPYDPPATRSYIAAALAAAGRALSSAAPFYLTLGSAADPRSERGARPARGVRVPDPGVSEAGVPHLYLRREEIEPFLAAAGLELTRVSEHRVDELVGAWAHATPEAMVHWFARARKI